MRAHTSAWILFVAYIATVSTIPLIELTHDFLHAVDNPFHHHAIRHQSHSTHTASEHHGFRKMRFAHEMEERSSIANLVWFAYTYCTLPQSFNGRSHSAVQEHFTRFSRPVYCALLEPLTPPPVVMRS